MTTTKRFTLLEFNEDAVVINPGTMSLIGVADFWFQRDVALEDGHHPLLAALGWQWEPLDKWKQHVIECAMRQQREALDYANGGPICVGPGRLFELAISGLPLMLQGLAPLTPGVIVDGASLPDDSLRIVRLAERYGFLPNLDGSEISRDDAAVYVDEAIEYLQQSNPHLTFSWSDTESGVLLAEEAVAEPPTAPNPRNGTHLRVLPGATAQAAEYVGQIVTVDDEYVDDVEGCVMAKAADGQRFPVQRSEWEVASEQL